MNSAPAPPGYLCEQALADHISNLRTLTRELHNELPGLNDPVLHTQMAGILGVATTLLDLHLPAPKPSIADDLAGLLSAVRAVRVPYRDIELGVTPTLERIRKAKGLIVTGLIDALEASEAVGLRPQRSPFLEGLAAAIPRAGIETLLEGIVRRLQGAERILNALNHEAQHATDFDQQKGLIRFYVGSMHVEIDLAKLQLIAGDTNVDFGALSRAVETMVSLTTDFAATVFAWRGRVSDAIIDIARSATMQVRRVASGARSVIKWVARSRRETKPVAPPARRQRIGDLLRETRTAHQIGLAEVASALRVRRKYLTAIEESRYAALPGAAYAIGFVRAYAVHIGLDGDAAVHQLKTEIAGLEWPSVWG
jgi:hypothetical protein